MRRSAVAALSFQAACRRTGRVIARASGDPLPWQGRARPVEGMTSDRVRVLLNALVRHLSRGCHIEVGAYRGATARAAAEANRGSTITVFEDYSEYRSRRHLREAVAGRRASDARLRLVEEDFFTSAHASTLRPGTMFYDGRHTVRAQAQAVLTFARLMQAPGVLVVDDWNWPAVRKGTLLGVAEADLVDSRIWELRTPANWDAGSFHNGLGILVLGR